WPFHLLWKNPLAAVRQTCKYGVPSALRYTYLAMTGDHGFAVPFFPFFGLKSGRPSFCLTCSRHLIGSSPAKLWTTKPSGAALSSLTASERSSALCPGPGTSASSPPTSPPKICAILLIEGRFDDIIIWSRFLGRQVPLVSKPEGAS